MKRKVEDSTDLFMTIIFILVILFIVFKATMGLGKSTNDKMAELQTQIQQTETANTTTVTK